MSNFDILSQLRFPLQIDNKSDLQFNWFFTQNWNEAKMCAIIYRTIKQYIVNEKKNVAIKNERW